MNEKRIESPLETKPEKSCGNCFYMCPDMEKLTTYELEKMAEQCTDHKFKSTLEPPLPDLPEPIDKEFYPTPPEPMPSTRDCRDQARYIDELERSIGRRDGQIEGLVEVLETLVRLAIL